MHVSGPLETDNQPFEPWKKVEAEADAAKRKYRHHNQRFWSEPNKNDVQKRRHKVTNDQHRQIGRAVICAMVVILFAANRAMVGNLQVAFEQRAVPAVRAFASEAAPHCRFRGTFDVIGGGILSCHSLKMDLVMRN